MSDATAAPAPTDPPNLDAAPSSSEPPASGGAPGGPPPANVDPAGADVPPAEASQDATPGAAAPVIESQPVDRDKVEVSELVEFPIQGSAVERGEPIPSVASVDEPAAEAASEQNQAPRAEAA